MSGACSPPVPTSQINRLQSFDPHRRQLSKMRAHIAALVRARRILRKVTVGAALSKMRRDLIWIRSSPVARRALRIQWRSATLRYTDQPGETPRTTT